MLYVADFKDGTQGKVEASDYRSALERIHLEHHKPMHRVRRGGLLDLAYRNSEQVTPRTYRGVAQAA